MFTPTPHHISTTPHTHNTPGEKCKRKEKNQTKLQLYLEQRLTDAGRGERDIVSLCLLHDPKPAFTDEEKIQSDLTVY